MLTEETSNNAPFRPCISKINNLFVNNTEDLDIVMPMYNLLEYSDNYSMPYRDEVNDDENEITTKQQQINPLNLRQK